MRALALTSPEMRGDDIRRLQKILNERLVHYRSRTRIVEDGVWGHDSSHALRTIAYTEGLSHYDGSPAVTRLIMHPHLRNPAELTLAHRRAEERNHHDTVIGAHTGLDRIPAIAAHYLGVHENPPRSNWGNPQPAGWEREFGFGSGVSWCGCFAGAMVIAAGGHVGSRVAFCPYIEADARTRSNGFDLWRPNHNEGVGPGWLVLFNWGGGSEPEHVEIVESIHADHLVAIGGNTSGTNPSDGGMVAREVRPYSVTVGYARPRI